MTAATTTAPTTRTTGRAPPPEHGDPFDRDVLPTPPGATAALLRSLLAPMQGPRGPRPPSCCCSSRPPCRRARCSSRTPSTAPYRRSARDDHGPLIAVAVALPPGVGGRRRAPVRLHPRLRPRQPGRAARPARPDLPARAGAQRRLPRALHLGPAHLPLHDGRRVAARTAQRGPPGAHHRHPVLRLHLGDAALARPGPRRGRRGLVRAAVPPHPALPAPRGPDLRVALDRDRRRHREVRGDDERHPAGARVPPRGRQRRGLPTCSTSRHERDQRRRASWRWPAMSSAPGWSPTRRSRGSCCGAPTGWPSDSLALGVLAAAVLYLRRLYDPIDRLGMFLNSYQSAAASLEKIAGLLAQAPSVPEPAAPRQLPELASEHPGREVVFDDVRFAYRTGGEVLPTFDLTLPAGQTVAVVGSTGAGKSTLAKLLARFYDPSDGRVLLDGVDLRDLSVPELRRGVVMVTQEAFLFSGTVAENIAIGRPDADPRGDRARREGDRRPRLHQRPARRLRHGRTQAGRPHLGRSAPTRRLRTGVARRPGGPDPRRGDQFAGRPGRAGRPARDGRRSCAAGRRWSSRTACRRWRSPTGCW